MEKQLNIVVRSSREGQTGWKGCIVLPAKHGEIVLCATIPDGTISDLRALLRGELVSGAQSWEEVGAEVGFGGLADLAGGAISAIASLFEQKRAAGPDQPRPGNLPAGGTAANIARIMRHVGITAGMSTSEAKAKLRTGAAQDWARADQTDALAAAEALTGATVPDIDSVAAAIAQIAAGGVPSPTQSQIIQPRIVPTPGLTTSILNLGTTAPGAVSPQPAQDVRLASMLGGGALLNPIAQMPMPQATDLFGASAPGVAQMVRGALRSLDTQAAANIADPAARAALQAARESTEQRVANALRIADVFVRGG